MKYYSTADPSHLVSAREAVIRGLAPAGGLYMPVNIPPLPSSFWEYPDQYSYIEIALEMMAPLFGEGLSRQTLERIIERVCQIPIGVTALGDYHLVELFHGPTHAFKDIGACFLASLLEAYQEFEIKELHILAATSGDTGGAVAAAFHGQVGIRVSILYPEGGVTKLQQQQLTTWGGNIQAIEVRGSFDDCQQLVKTAFSDQELKNERRLSSANSINIGRWLSQAIYYAEAYRQLSQKNPRLTVAVPCGNLGNISAGMVAWKMGLPVNQWIACTNENDMVPAYLAHGDYQPRLSIKTVANAMDVGDPSNFIRMKILGGSTWNLLKNVVSGYAIPDDTILQMIDNVYRAYGYIIDPHTATAWAGIEEHRKSCSLSDNQLMILSTAHPSKFGEVVESVLGFQPELAADLKRVKDLPCMFIQMEPSYAKFREYLQE